jgi:uncharacterized protein YeaO (DUF488 family)
MPTQTNFLDIFDRIDAGPVTRYTSYFGAISKLSDNDIVPISIARYANRYVKTQSYSALAPSKELLSAIKSGEITAATYSVEFKKQLAELNPNEVISKLDALAGNQSYALLCYCKPGEFCHRHLVSEWLGNAGIKIKEFGSK